MKNRKKITQRIKEIREKQGLTQEKVAKDMGVSIKTYRSWEKENTYPKTTDLIKLADYYEVSIDYLVGRIEHTTHDIDFICNETGLSEEAVEILNEPIKVVKDFIEVGLKAIFVTSTIMSTIIEAESIHQFTKACFDYIKDIKSMTPDLKDLSKEHLKQIKRKNLYDDITMGDEESTAIALWKAEREFSSLLESVAPKAHWDNDEGLKISRDNKIDRKIEYINEIADVLDRYNNENNNINQEQGKRDLLFLRGAAKRIKNKGESSAEIRKVVGLLRDSLDESEEDFEEDFED